MTIVLTRHHLQSASEDAPGQQTSGFSSLSSLSSLRKNILNGEGYLPACPSSWNLRSDGVAVIPTRGGVRTVRTEDSVGDSRGTGRKQREISCPHSAGRVRTHSGQDRGGL